MDRKYTRLAQQLRQELPLYKERGVLKLPSEAALMRAYSVSRQTVRRAISLLSSQGLLESRQGSGTYICYSTGPASKRIAVMVPFPDQYRYPAFLHELRTVLSEQGYQVTVYATEDSVAQERRLLEDLVQQPPAALLSQGCKTALPNPNTDLYEQLRLQGVCVAFLFSAYPAFPEAVCIGPEDDAGGYQLTKYLLDKGHRHIAGIFRQDDLQGHQRYYGCAAALRDADLLPPDDHVFWYDANDQAALLLEQPPAWLTGFVRDRLSDATAVVCHNDEIAYYLIRALQAAGKRVPEEVAVVGFDNSYYATLGSVAITSLGNAPNAIPHAAAACLLQLIRGVRYTPQALPWTLFERASSK